MEDGSCGGQRDFPEQCRYVLEMLGHVYKYDADARQRHLSPAERLKFHQQHSGPVLQQLHQWLAAQFALKQWNQIRVWAKHHLLTASLERADGVSAGSRPHR